MTVKVIQETSDSPKALLFKGESFQPFPDPDQREAHQLTLTDIAEEVDADHDYTTYDASQEGNGPNGETNYKYTYPPPPAQSYNYSTEVIPEEELPARIKGWWED